MKTKDNLRRLTGTERLGQTRASEYMGAEDIDPGTEPVVTIEGIYSGMATLQRGKELKDIVAFAEESVPGIHKVRPLIINSTNRKTLRKLFGDTTAGTLEGKRIQLWVDHNVRDPSDGGKTDGIRIRPFHPKVKAQQPKEYLCSNCGKPIIPTSGYTAEYLANYTKSKYGCSLCAACATAQAQADSTAQTENTPDNEGSED